MDPQKDTGSTPLSDEKTNKTAPEDDASAITDTGLSGDSSAPSLSSDNTSTPSLSDEGPAQGQAPQSGGSSEAGDGFGDKNGLDTKRMDSSSSEFTPAPTDVAFNKDAQSSISSEESSASASPSGLDANTSPAQGPDLGNDALGTSAGLSSAHSDATDPSAETPGSPIPPTAPVPAHGADKKTIMTLAVVAVVLIVAIIVLFFS